MSGPAFEDVEALLDSAANGHKVDSKVSAEHHNGNEAKTEGLNGARHNNNSSEHGSRNGDDRAHSSALDSTSNKRRRSRSRDSHRSRRPRESDDHADRSRASADHYRGNGRPRSRSRSPRREADRHYRPSGGASNNGGDRRDRDDHRGRGGDRSDRRRSRSPRTRRSRSPPRNKAQFSEEERDSRTVFVQQLAARLRTKQLQEFFAEAAGPVVEAQIVKDRVSKRSKGVGYVEFESEESVQKAIQLTGRQLAGIPIIVQLTEAEKNRQARNPGEASGNASSVPFHRLYVGNIHFSITEEDLQNVFEPFGELEFVQLQKEEGGRSRGYGFVQFREPEHAKEALEKMNGFELAGRPIRVGLGNDKFTPESTASHLQRFPGQARQQQFQGSSFSGSGGRGAHAGGSGVNGSFDRAGGRDNEKAGGGASALDDTDVSGVNFNNYSRNDLMRKLARTDEPSNGGDKSRAPPKPVAKPVHVPATEPSRCIVLHNMFDPVQEAAGSENWVKELEQETKDECEEKYGHVMHISVDPDSAGDVYIKFDRAQGGDNAIKGLNGRYFAGLTITAQPMVEAIYNTQFPRSKGL